MGNYYWYEGKKIVITSSPTQRAVRFKDAASPDTRRSVAKTIGASSSQSIGLDLGNGIILYEINE